MLLTWYSEAIWISFRSLKAYSNKFLQYLHWFTLLCRLLILDIFNSLTCITHAHCVVQRTYGIYFVIRLDYCAGIFRRFWFYEDFTHGRIWDDRFRAISAFLVQFCVKAFPEEGSFLYIEENGLGSDNLWTCHDCYFLILECTFAGYVQFSYHNIYHVVSFCTCFSFTAF